MATTFMLQIARFSKKVPSSNEVVPKVVGKAMTEEINQLLKTAIQAAKAGERKKAHQLLLQIVEQDEKNEMAWLWLSGTVKTNEDRQICLENVLAINPDNEMAKKGLKKLGVPIPQAAPPVAEEPGWEHPQYDLLLPEAKDPHAPKFQDAWSSSADLCAYCAQPVQRSDRRCPKCKRAMVGKEPVFPQRSKYLTVWVILRSISHFFGLLGIFFFGISLSELPPEIPFSVPVFWIVAFITWLMQIGFTAALFFRQVWAYWITILGLLLMVVWVVAAAFSSFSIPVPAANVSGLSTLFSFICIAPFIILQLLYAYMIIMAGGDFKKVTRWRVAAADERIKDPLVLDKAGKLFAQRGMWATAVLYWQRAVGRSPGNVAILQRLADGYARLGFPERSLDALQQAQEKTLDPHTRQQLAKQIESLSQKVGQTAVG